MNYRKGDTVSIVGTVKHNQDDGNERVFIELPDYHTDIWIKPEFVTLVQANFEVGDKCRWVGLMADCATILAISESHAWIYCGGGDYCTRMLTTIEKVDSDD